jgi:hypothetical protein
MPSKKRYELIYDIEVRGHLSRIERKYHSLIQRHIEGCSAYNPEIETRNRKPLSRPCVLGSAWELRFGPRNSFRVFYRTNPEEREVYILAIGVKRGNRLFIGGKEFQL